MISADNVLTVQTKCRHNGDMQNTEVLATVTITDQNTGNPVVWKIEVSKEVGPNTARDGGWTHHFICTRPRGRKAYGIYAELIGDVVVRTSRPVCAW